MARQTLNPKLMKKLAIASVMNNRLYCFMSFHHAGSLAITGKAL
jgi:hypothetical protein